jgi:hypothetical protein
MTNINPESNSNSSFWQSLQDFRTSNNLEELEIEADVFADVRDKTPGRIDETTYLLKSPKNAQCLYKALKQLKEGQYQKRELIDN